MWKKLALATVIICFSASGVSEGFGLISQDSTRRIDGVETNISLELLNIGNTTREVTVNFQETRNYDITPRQIELTLEPSEITDLPGKGRWFSLGGGRYISITSVNAKLEINTSSPVRNFSIPVSVTSTPLRNEKISDTGQKVYQEREEVLKVYTESDLLETSEGVLYDEGKLFDTEASDQENTEGNNSSNSSVGGSSVTPEKGLTEETENQGEAVNAWTLILITGIVFSIGMIWSEL